MRDSGQPGGGGGSDERGSRPLIVDVTRPDPSTVVITPVGELDLLTAEAFSDGIEVELTARTPRVVIDLTRLTFFGSAGLSVVVDAAQRATDAGARLTVVVGRSVAARVLDITGLIGVLPVKDTLADALAE